jgi:tetratricopeptide (TPR) repeat protein
VSRVPDPRPWRRIGHSSLLRACGRSPRARRRPTVNPDAHEAYLLGQYHVARRTADSLARSIDYFQKPIRLDPSFALAHAGLSKAYQEADVWAGVGVGKHAAEVRSSALRAIELDPDLAEAHFALAGVKFRYDWDWPGADASYRKVFELNPNLADAYALFSYYLVAMGRFDEAIASARRATTLDPLSPGHFSDLGRTLYRARRYDDAIASYLRALELDGAHGAQGATRRDSAPIDTRDRCNSCPVTAARRAETVRIRA